MAMEMAMAMADEQQFLLQKVHSLSDLELAALLSLVAREHCLVSTVPESVDELAEELRLIASHTFNLSSAIVSCHAHTTLDDFATALLVPPPPARVLPSSSPSPRSVSPYQQRRSSNNKPENATAYNPAPGSSGSYFPGLRLGGNGAGLGGGGGNGPTTSSPPAVGGTTSQQQQQQQQPHIANVILAKDLDRAPRAVQIQALELLRTRRIFTRTNVQTAPKQFLFVAVLGAASGGQARVTPHLNDFFYIAHWHDADEFGFEHLDREWGAGRARASGGGDGLNEGDYDDDDYDGNDAASTDSSRSVVKRGSLATATSTHTATNNSSNHNNNNNTDSHGNHLAALDGWRSPTPTLTNARTASQQLSSSSSSSAPQHQQHQQPPQPHDGPVFSDGDIAFLGQLAQAVHVSVEMTRYQANIASFVRMHRAVAADSGASPAATKHFGRLARSLAALHGLDHVTPSLVALAARKVYLHRLRTVTTAPDRERSMQWGSQLAAVAALLDGVGPEGVLDDVLDMVAVPC